MNNNTEDQLNQVPSQLNTSTKQYVVILVQAVIDGNQALIAMCRTVTPECSLKAFDEFVGKVSA